LSLIVLSYFINLRTASTAIDLWKQLSRF